MIPPISSPPLYSANNINLEDNSTVFFSISSQQKKLVKKLIHISNAQMIIESYIKITSPAEVQAKLPIINQVKISFALNKDNFVIDSTTNLIISTVGSHKSGAKKLSPVRSKRKHKKKSLAKAKNISIRHEHFIKTIGRYFIVYRKKNRHEILDILL